MQISCSSTVAGSIGWERALVLFHTFNPTTTFCCKWHCKITCYVQARYRRLVPYQTVPNTISFGIPFVTVHCSFFLDVGTNLLSATPMRLKFSWELLCIGKAMGIGKNEGNGERGYGVSYLLNIEWESCSSTKESQYTWQATDIPEIIPVMFCFSTVEY